MNWDQVQGNWKQFKGKVRTQWGKLTDNDLEQIAGRQQQLVGKLQELYGIERAEAERQLTQFLDSLPEMTPERERRPVGAAKL